MTALDDRNRWLAHLHECTRCPANRCHQGDELAAAVRETLAPGDHWQGVYRPKPHQHGPHANWGGHDPAA
jgi:hypothetical protein